MSSRRPELVHDGVYRCGTDFVNWYIVESDGRLLIVDAGLPGYWPQLDEALGAIGRRLRDIAGILLTHGHADHVGFAPRLSAERGIPMWIPADDLAMVTVGETQRAEASPLRYFRYPFAYAFMVHFLRHGGRRVPRAASARTYSDGDRLELPGSPRAVHVPGHTSGMSAIYLETFDTLVAGDALCNLNPLTGRRGPQLLPRAFNVDTELARRSVARLADLGTAVTVFGHGEPWRTDIAEAVMGAEGGAVRNTVHRARS